MDLINRQDAIDVIRATVAEGVLADTLELRLNELSSAEKTGHWIYKNGAMVSPWYSSYECSECGCLSGYFKYCPECGSRNRGEEE